MFLSEDMGVAVDDRRHGEITHLAHVISVRDLVYNRSKLTVQVVPQYQVLNGLGFNFGPRHQLPRARYTIQANSR